MYYTCEYVCIYIYIYIERERDIHLHALDDMHVPLVFLLSSVCFTVGLAVRCAGGKVYSRSPY